MGPGSWLQGWGKREEEEGNEFWDGDVFHNQDVLEEEKSEIRLAGFGHAEVEVSEEHWLVSTTQRHNLDFRGKDSAGDKDLGFSLQRGQLKHQSAYSHLEQAWD